MSEFEKMGQKEDFQGVIDNMMRQLLSKDVMYTPIKEICEKVRDRPAGAAVARAWACMAHGFPSLPCSTWADNHAYRMGPSKCALGVVFGWL